MIEQTPWWKGIKFWITLLLAACAAAAIGLLLHERADADEPAAVKWRPRVEAAQRDLGAALLARGTPEPQRIVDWVTRGLLPDLPTLWDPERPDGSIVKLDRKQVACLAQLEWYLAVLAHRLRQPDEVDGMTIDALDQRMRDEPLQSVTDVAYLVARLDARGPEAVPLLDRVYRAWMRGKGKHDRFVREALGYTEFRHPIDPDLAFRRHPFIREVERANKHRWFTPNETLELARARVAAQRLAAHSKRLVTDSQFRAVESLKANLFERTEFRGLYIMTHWADPFLVCFVSDRNLGPDTRVGYDPPTSDDVVESPERRRAALGLMRARGVLYQAVYREFKRRWAEPLAFKPLMDPYGGRPDYPVQERSYADGCPLVALLFDDRVDRDARDHVLYRDFASRPRGSPYQHARFQDRPGRVVALETPLHRRDPEGEWHEHAHAAAHAVWLWSIRQRNNWGWPRPTVDFGSEAMTAQLCALKREAGGIAFGAWSGVMLKQLQRYVASLRKQGFDKSPWLPLRFLVSVTRTGQIANYMAEKWGLGQGAHLLYEVHAAAFARMCLHGDDPRLKTAFVKWMDLIAHGESGRRALKSFEESFRIYVEEDYEPLQERLNEVLDAMLKEDPTRWHFDFPVGR